jgi:hypothetical protein
MADQDRAEWMQVVADYQMSACPRRAPCNRGLRLRGRSVSDGAQGDLAVAEVA